MTKDLKSDRWSCPSDRNLQLRSKLNAGWSYYTNKKSLKKDPQLTESELIEIQKVLQRSEMLERFERERVMKLVDRLENMKRNSNVSSNSSHNRCALCGDYFYILRYSPNQCGFCQKVLCSKCCIDTTCAIDSNSNFSSSSSMISRRNSSSSVSNQISTKVYLCRICSEQREFLKKSGAWFLKKYPSYLDNNSMKSTTSGSNLNENTGKYNSTSNLSQIEKSSFDEPKPSISSFASPMNLRRNISTSSATFRFWKTKESLQNFLTGNYNNNNNNSSTVCNNSNQISSNNGDLDSVFNFSNDTNGENEVNSNYDSITTRTISSENINLKTPTSPAPSASLGYNSNGNNNNNSLNGSTSNSKNDNFNFNTTTPSSSNYNMNNNRPKSNENSPNYKNENSPNTSNKNDVNKFNFTNINRSNTNNEDNNQILNKKSSSHQQASKLNSTLNSDEEQLSTSPNMSNYNYYSNILTNSNLNELNDNKNANLDDLKKNYDNINKIKKSSNSIILTNSFKLPKKNLNNIDISNNNNNNDTSTSLTSFNSIENGLDSKIVNNYNNQSDNAIFKKNEIRSRSFKKPKIFEWCSTQLSKEKEDGSHKSSLKLAKQSLSNYLSKKKAMNASYSNNNSNLNGKTKHINSGIFKKNSSQHESINDLADLGTDSIAAKSFSAVSSASSLSVSLNKLNMK